MKIFRSLFDFYINSSIHVALAAYALTWITLIEYDLSYDRSCLYFVFFASITGYNFVKYFGLVKFHHRSLARWLRVIQVFSFISFLIMSYFAFYLEINTIILTSILGLITFLYAIPMIPRKYLFDEQQNLRQISGVKVYVIAIVWTITTVILPLLNNKVIVDFDVVITSIQRFCFLLVMMLPFEIRDLNYDNLKLATIPQRLGVKRTKAVGALLLVLFFLLEYFKNELTGYSILSTLIITIVALIFLVFSNKRQSKYYSSFWVESLPIMWLALLVMFS